MTTDVLSEIVSTRRYRNNIFNVLKGKSKPKLSNENFVTLDVKAQPSYMLYTGIPLYTHTHTNM
jgi:hypothetical protein